MRHDLDDVIASATVHDQHAPHQGHACPRGRRQRGRRPRGQRQVRDTRQRHVLTAIPAVADLVVFSVGQGQRGTLGQGMTLVVDLPADTTAAGQQGEDAAYARGARLRLQPLKLSPLINDYKDVSPEAPPAAGTHAVAA
jgi:hypothetical protein